MSILLVLPPVFDQHQVIEFQLIKDVIYLLECNHPVAEATNSAGTKPVSVAALARRQPANHEGAQKKASEVRQDVINSLMKKRAFVPPGTLC